MGPDDDLVTTGEADEARLTDTTRDVLGASYYWVMDLAGSVWERVVTFGHPRGRAFRGTHGDGRITEYGDATNEDWPLGDADGRRLRVSRRRVLRARDARRGRSIRTARSRTGGTDRGAEARARSPTASVRCARRRQ